jgi:hypothetical protein
MIAQTAAERTRSQLVQVIGRKFVLYREGRDEKKKIILPPAGKAGRKHIQNRKRPRSLLPGSCKGALYICSDQLFHEN